MTVKHHKSRFLARRGNQAIRGDSALSARCERSTRNGLYTAGQHLVPFSCVSAFILYEVNFLVCQEFSVIILSLPTSHAPDWSALRRSDGQDQEGQTQTVK